MLLASTKIWLNPFVSRTIKELYESHYNGEYLVTQDCFGYFCISSLCIQPATYEQFKDTKLCKIVYNKGKNSLICSNDYVNGCAMHQIPFGNETKLRVIGLHQEFDVDSIEQIAASTQEEYFTIRQESAFSTYAKLYCFAGDEPICIKA